MVTFFSDIDNTLLFSHHREIEGKKLCVERLKGREQGYVTQYTYDVLKVVEDIALVPVTTRTELQYDRISEFFSKLGVRYALICNGGELLVDGQIDLMWHDESLELAKMELSAVIDAGNSLKQYVDQSKIHFVKEYLIYATVENPENIALLISNGVDIEKVYVGFDSRKIYIIARSINKGDSIKRLQKKLGIKKTIAAGDSDFDISMLNIADIALIPKNLIGKVNNRNTILIDEGIFSNGICSFLKYEYGEIIDDSEY